MKFLTLAAASTALLASGLAAAGTTTVPQLPGSSGMVSVPSTSVRAAFPNGPGLGINGASGLYNRLMELPGALKSDSNGDVTVPVELRDGRIVNVTLDSSGNLINVER